MLVKKVDSVSQLGVRTSGWEDRSKSFYTGMDGCVHIWGVHAMVCMWRSEESLLESFLSSYHVSLSIKLWSLGLVAIPLFQRHVVSSVLGFLTNFPEFCFS